ncbi:Cytochrome P450 [Penicillium angulare]|uniref:Cytochrome P450 n=1 Tax=Penicillium angulare TaxID=116970 RepID=UPI0025421305|nr:Cytochrome P450 [Penicillium angulare]KAJ5280334.1 Cytochrome P450 [Penicillium angulare]
MFVNLIARATSRVIAGEALRRNEEWLETASSYSVNVGLTILLLRPVPTYLRPLVARFLPPVQQMKSQLQFVKDLFIPIINERRASHEKAVQENDPGYVAPDDLLQWMMDMGETKEDEDPKLLAHHMLLLMSLAVVHTSAMAMCHALYDLLQRPEYIAPLRKEIMATLTDGWENATKRSFDNQRRLDSFLRESQRFGSPGELSFHRIVMEPLALSDGLFLPVGTHICFPSGPISKDPTHVENPETFDGFRWCQNPTDRNALREISGQKTPTEEKHSDQSRGDEKSNQQQVLKQVPSTSTSFVSISASSMHFGAGAQACPGRFFAGCSIKAIFSKIIMDYDFKYEEGRCNWRPANICVGEHILPNTGTTVMFRKRLIEVA